eukprot:447246-Prorocentrum_minimum.AAC.3
MCRLDAEECRRAVCAMDTRGTESIGSARELSGSCLAGRQPSKTLYKQPLRASNDASFCSARDGCFKAHKSTECDDSMTTNDRTRAYGD